MASRARSKIHAPVFEPEVFWKQIYCVEESTSDIDGTFRRPRSHSAPGELRPPCPSLYVSDGPCSVRFSIFMLNVSDISFMNYVQYS